MFRRILPGVLASTIGAFCLVSSVHASPFVYTERDLMLCFRVIDTGVYDLEVDIGSISNYLALPPGSSVNISQYNISQLNDCFATLDGVSWSVGTYVAGNDHTSQSTYPPATLFLTEARLDPSVQTAPWQRENQNAQGLCLTVMASLANGAYTYSAAMAPGPDNTTTAVRVQAGDPSSCDAFLDDNGDYSTTWEGSVENTTPIPFVSPAISDFYAIVPLAGGGDSVYLGYFELSPSGTLTFTAASTNAPPPPPPVLSISKTGSVNNISVLTTNGANYTVYFTNSSGFTTPTVNWPVFTNFVGTGGIQTFGDTSTDDARFYRATVH